MVRPNAEGIIFFVSLYYIMIKKFKICKTLRNINCFSFHFIFLIFFIYIFV